MCHESNSVRSLREQHGFTQKALASAVGVQQAMIAHIESGERKPSLKLAVKLAQLFGVTVETLYESLPEKVQV